MAEKTRRRGGGTRGRGEEERMAGTLEWRMMWRQPVTASPLSEGIREEQNLTHPPPSRVSV
jgi:hypothetical protein